MSDWPDMAGRLVADGGHVLPIRVYYEDTDFSGAVYHANYLKFCERGRSDFLRLKNIYHHEIAAENGGGFVVRKMLCDFLKPARIDDLLCVESQLLALSGARIEMQQKVLRAAECLFAAKITIALVDGKGRPQKLPEAMIARLKQN